MIGQKEVQQQLMDMANIDCLPRFLILTGEKGNGKTTLARWLARMLKAYLVEPELSVDSVREVVKNCYKCAGETLYVFRDADRMSSAAKNALLKITEEPPRQAHFVLTVQNPENALETLRSRATVIPMQAYSEEELATHLNSYKPALDDETKALIISVAENPGQVERLADMDVKALDDFCQLVVDKIGTVTGVNAFKICQRIKMKEDGEGYDPDLFFLMLKDVLLKDMKASSDEGEIHRKALMLQFTCQYAREMTLVGVKKDSTMDMWVLAMREVA